MEQEPMLVSRETIADRATISERVMAYYTRSVGDVDETVHLRGFWTINCFKWVINSSN